MKNITLIYRWFCGPFTKFIFMSQNVFDYLKNEIFQNYQFYCNLKQNLKRNNSLPLLIHIYFHDSFKSFLSKGIIFHSKVSFHCSSSFYLKIDIDCVELLYLDTKLDSCLHSCTIIYFIIIYCCCLTFQSKSEFFQFLKNVCILDYVQ